jgi:hypothetical protein
MFKPKSTQPDKIIHLNQTINRFEPMKSETLAPHKLFMAVRAIPAASLVRAA